MSLVKLKEKLANGELVEFEEVMKVIAENYQYTPSRFVNGIDGDCIVNEAGANEGSHKIFTFAKLNNLTEKQTLACFGKYYREDVLLNPDGQDHQNIRTFMKYGWQGVNLDNS